MGDAASQPRRYADEVTANCERVLVTLMSRLGPQKESFFLVGGLTPRYLVKARPPEVPPHGGTGDIDVVVDVAVLAGAEAYRTLEENLRRMGFAPVINAKGNAVTWRWRIEVAAHQSVILEFLAEHPKRAPGQTRALPEEQGVTAVNIPHASMVIDLHDRQEVTAELLGGDGVSTQIIAHANLVSFICLKAFAMDQRREDKDAHDLVYCLRYVEGGLERAVADFAAGLEGAHGKTIADALAILRRQFAGDGPVEGYNRPGPMAVARYDLGAADANREARALRQREASGLVEMFLERLAAWGLRA